MPEDPSNIPVPILMYHRVAEHDSSGFSTTPQRFESQIAFLRRRGFQGVGPWQIAQELHQPEIAPPANVRRICITFDDGYEDTYTTAWPILEKYGFRATIFLVSARVGQTNVWDHPRGIAPAALLSWTQAREMQRHGFAFESHGCTHAHLPTLTPAELQYELAVSHQTIEQEMGAPVGLFSYPYCEADEAVRHAVQRAGYIGAVGGLGSVHEPYLMSRIEAARDTWMPLAVELSPAYRRLRSSAWLRWAGRPLRARRIRPATASVEQPRPAVGVS